MTNCPSVCGTLKELSSGNSTVQSGNFDQNNSHIPVALDCTCGHGYDGHILAECHERFLISDYEAGLIAI